METRRRDDATSAMTRWKRDDATTRRRDERDDAMETRRRDERDDAMRARPGMNHAALGDAVTDHVQRIRNSVRHDANERLELRFVSKLEADALPKACWVAEILDAIVDAGATPAFRAPRWTLAGAWS